MQIELSQDELKMLLSVLDQASVKLNQVDKVLPLYNKIKGSIKEENEPEV